MLTEEADRMEEGGSGRREAGGGEAGGGDKGRVFLEEEAQKQRVTEGKGSPTGS